jgi:hypothetical protein
MIDASEIGNLTMNLIDSIEEDFGDAEMTRILVVAQVEYVDDDGDRAWTVRWKSGDDPIAVLGMVDAVTVGIKGSAV